MPQLIYPWKNCPVTDWIEGWLGYRDGLDVLWNWKISFFSEAVPIHPAHSLVNVTTELSWPRTSKSAVEFDDISW